MVPTPAGYPIGPLKYLGVSSFMQTLFLLAVFAYLCLSIVSVFENRFHNVCVFPGKSILTWFRFPWLCAHYVMVIVLLIPLQFFIPDQQVAVRNAFKKLPCLPQEIYNSPIFVLTENYIYHICSAFFYSVAIVFQGGIFATFLVWSSLKSLHAKSISLKTFQMQKKFFIALVIQMLVPMAFYILPILYISASVVFNYYNQALTNLAFTLTSSHGLVATLAMLILHKPYREAVLAMLRKNTGRSQNASQNNMNRKVKHRSTKISPTNLEI